MSFLTYGEEGKAPPPKLSPVTEIYNEYLKTFKRIYGFNIRQTIKDRAIISRMLKEIPDAKDYIMYCLNNWTRLSALYNINSLPTISVIYGFRSSLYKFYMEHYK